MIDADLLKDGFCLLPRGIDAQTVERLLELCHTVFEDASDDVRARSSRGHVYAARNLIKSIPEVKPV